MSRRNGQRDIRPPKFGWSEVMAEVPEKYQWAVFMVAVALAVRWRQVQPEGGFSRGPSDLLKDYTTPELDWLEEIRLEQQAVHLARIINQYAKNANINLNMEAA